MTQQKHTVKQGEYLAQIAAKCGLSNYKAIWDHPENAELKKKRGNPNVLYPGDVVFIPEKVLKQETITTDQRHHFKVSGHVNKLRLLIKDAEQHPLANTPCQLSIEFKTYQLTTDADGKIEKTISSTATRGQLVIQDRVIPLLIGHLDPIDEPSGWQARLNNLGYNAGSPDSADELQIRSAVEEFQCDNGLQVDGECGPLTQKKLKEAHGC